MFRYCIRAIKGEAERLKELNPGNKGVAVNEGDNYGVTDITILPIWELPSSSLVRPGVCLI